MHGPGGSHEVNEVRMTTLDLGGTEYRPLAVALMHGSTQIIGDGYPTLVPTGHCLSRERIRQLAQSECINVTAGTRSAGLAAYKKVESDVRVVHEFLVNCRLDDRGNEIVTHMMLSALEMLSCDEGIHALIVVLGPNVSLVPFEQHGYATLIADSGGAWLQKKFDTAPWTAVASHRHH
jgi:hypothetical protein